MVSFFKLFPAMTTPVGPQKLFLTYSHQHTLEAFAKLFPAVLRLLFLEHPDIFIIWKRITFFRPSTTPLGIKKE